jgi:MFS family permease
MTDATWRSPHRLREKLETALLTPIRAFRLRYLPLLMVYFAYGALGIITIAESFWIKSALTLTPSELAALSVWLTLPWTIKMVFGELIDAVPVFGSQRRAYVLIGGMLVALGLLTLAGAAGGWLTFANPQDLYRIGSFLSVVGVVLQDVAADAMSTEVVERENPDGTPRDARDINRDLGMVQVLGRLALSLGLVVVAGLGGWLASIYSYETVFLCGLIIPVISVSGAFLIEIKSTGSRPVDWRILGGGLVFGAAVMAMAISGVPYGQEIVFVVSMAVVSAMLWHVVGDLDRDTQTTIFYAAIIIFAFRATPLVGQGYTWFTIDVLGFDEAFQGTLNQIGALLALIGTWLFSDAITGRPIPVVLFWLTLAATVLSLPSLALTLGISEWTEATFGFGARTIAIIDTAASSPFLQLSMIPLLTLCAIYAPEKRRATWFALMGSLMNLALVAGALQTKYLNQVLVVDRGSYENLPLLLGVVMAIGLCVPLAAILLFGKKLSGAEVGRRNRSTLERAASTPARETN